MLRRIDIFLHLFWWALSEHWYNNIKAKRFLKGVKNSWKESWIDSKPLLQIHKDELLKIHKKEVKKPSFESEHEIYKD